MFTLRGNSPWLLLARNGANQGLGLSSQLCPVVCWAAATSRHGTVESSSPVVVVVAAGPMVIKESRLETSHTGGPTGNETYRNTGPVVMAQPPVSRLDSHGFLPVGGGVGVGGESAKQQ